MMKRRRIFLAVLLFFAWSTSAVSWEDAEADDEWHNEWIQSSQHSHTRSRRNAIDGVGTCMIWTGAHLKSFDNRLASFNSECPLTLMKEYPNNKFSISYEPPVDCNNLNCSLKMHISIGDSRYELSDDGSATLAVMKDKEPVRSMIAIQLDLLFSYIGSSVVIKLPKFNLIIKWDKKLNVEIHAPAELSGQTVGMCGFWDGDRTNDWQDIDLQDHNLANFVASWLDKDIAASSTCSKTVNTTSPCDDENYVGSQQLKYCGQMNQVAFKPCFEKFDKEQAFMKACEWDFCAHSQETSCQSITNFATECRNQDVKLPSSWRRPNFCPFECSNGYVHDECGPEKHMQCSTNVTEHTSASTCVEGCYCPPGKVEHNKTCINVETCTCPFDGKDYQPREEAWHRCYNCTCTNGKWECPNEPCFVTGSVGGDPHYATFDNRYYDFMGPHKYYLVKTHNLSIETQHFKCNVDWPVTCVSSMTVRYNGSVIDLQQNHVVSFNGHALQLHQLPVTSGQVRVKQASSHLLMVELKDIKVLIQWYQWYYSSVHIPDNFLEIRGLLGNINGNAADDFMTPEGNVETDANKFGESWRVIDDSVQLEPGEVEAEAPQNSLDQCNQDPIRRDEARRRCNIIKSGVFEQCESVVQNDNFFENCMIDICFMEDPNEFLCAALSMYAMECAHKNVKLEWRNEVPECAIKCPLGQIHQVCGDSCSRSCKDINLNDRCDSVCAEGCNCPPGETLDKNGDCIPVTECPCLYQGIEYPANTKHLKGKGPQTEICECGRGTWNCTRATIWDRRNCTQFPDPATKCEESLGMEYTECKPFLPRTCQDTNTVINTEQPIFCNPGCACKQGYVYDIISKKCYEEKKCPCHHSDKLYDDGNVTKHDCKTCTCNNGHWNCDDSECLGTCKVFGLSHFESFDKRSYDFNGLCTYLLVQSETSPVESFKIGFTNHICGPEGVPCSRSLTIDIGSGESLESVVLTKSVTPQSTKRMDVRENGQFIFVDVADLKLSVRWDKINEITITLNKQWKNLVTGMCGNFNGKDGDDFKTPTSGDLVETNPNIFGDSWKLDPECTDEQEPKDNCAEHPDRKNWATEKCKILHTTFKDCHAAVPVEKHYKMCVEDACGCESGDDCHCLCSAVASYAQKCNENNIPIKWRTQDTCPMQCDKQGTFYSPCVSSCAMKTCDNSLMAHVQDAHLCNTHVCVEGCGQYECPEGHIYKSKEDPICIPKSECKPVCMTIGNITYHEGEMIEFDDCHSCFCTRHHKKCIGQPCLETSTPPPIEQPCPEGFMWRDCLYNCSTLCHSMKEPPVAEGLCTDTNQCIPGCGKKGLDCAKDGLKWRSAEQCVEADDCTCLSSNGVLVKPNTFYEEGRCTKCECHGNVYKCEDVCSVEETTPLPSECTMCPNVNQPATCPCSTGLFWDGKDCVAKDACPCVVNDLKYAVGSRFLLKDCSDCLCRKGGETQCQAFECPSCENPEYQSERTGNCDCICKPCPQGFRICPTSRICIREEQWCDGIVHCADDEKNCIPPPPPVCPPVPQCEEGWVAKQIIIAGVLCPDYECVEGPKNVMCSIDGGILSSFDDTRFAVDLCDHTIIQHNLWNVSAVNDCTFNNGSCNFHVKVNIGDVEIKVYQDFSVEYRGKTYPREQVDLLIKIINIFNIDLTGNSLSLSWFENSITLSIGNQNNLRIDIPSAIARPLRGLCGTANGDPRDDLMKPNGELAENTAEFISSWKNTHSQASCTPTTCSKEHTEMSREICNAIPRTILDLNDCNLNLEQLIESCAKKTCECLKSNEAQECRCNAARDFVSTCLEQKRVELDFSSWRVEANCPAECPANEVSNDCFLHKCERKCSNLRKPCEIGTICNTGCFCKDGYVRKGDTCVLPSQCDDCSCEGYSGGKLITFDRNEVLTTNHGSFLVSGAQNAAGIRLFDIIATKCKCDDQPGSACTQSLTVMHQGNTITMRWTEEMIETTINGVKVNEFPVDNLWVEVESNTNRQVSLVLLDLNVKVSFLHISRSYTITAPSHTLGGQMEGLCGKCSNNDTNDDETEVDWRLPNITMGIDKETCEAIIVDECSADSSIIKSCNMINDVDIFGECHDVVDTTPFIQTCQEQACRDPNALCRISQAYADKCRNYGRCLHWRSESFCPNQECPPSFEYNSCGPGCCQTCSVHKKECKFPNIEGCFCPTGKVLRGDICVPAKECEACDDKGHFIGSTWNPSKCETCACENIGEKPVMKCETMKCNELICNVGEELITAPDQNDVCCPKQACSASQVCEEQQKPQCQQDQELHQTSTNNCTGFVCSCVPKEKCQPIEITPEEALEEGMERTIDASGCCPREALVCNKDKCKEPACEPLNVEIVQGTDKNCCPTYRCVPPKNKCVYYPKYVAGGSVLLPTESLIPTLYDLWATWNDGLCLRCRCNNYVNRQPEATCSKNCPGVTDANNYVYKEEIVKDACCPLFTRTACKDNGDVYEIGSKWTSKTDNCKEYECLLENGIVERKLTSVCPTTCGLGQEFVDAGPTDCCGKCVDSKCVHEGVLRAIGTVWKSIDSCTSFTCKRNALGRAEVTSSTTHCPDLTCPVDQQQASKDGCCMVCHPFTTCESRVSSENTVGVFSVLDPQRGLCKNILPVEDFAECIGNCETKTRYIDGKDISDCNCCRVDSFKKINVTLTCNQNEAITKIFQVPQTCKCTGCGMWSSGTVKNVDGLI